MLATVVALLSTKSALGGQQAITFDDLPDPSAQTFRDPFRDMGFRMLGELQTVVRLEQRLQTGEVSGEHSPRLVARLDKARRTLEAGGYDIDKLLSQRWTVATNRRRAALATNPAIADKRVILAGFLIPAGTDEDGKRTGYLVARVGMCSHIASPPPNRLLRVKYRAVPKGATLYTSVIARGKLRAQKSDATVFIQDGQTRMVSMWTLEAEALHLAKLPHIGPEVSATQAGKKVLTDR